MKRDDTTMDECYTNETGRWMQTDEARDKAEEVKSGELGEWEWVESGKRATRTLKTTRLVELYGCE